MLSISKFSVVRHAQPDEPICKCLARPKTQARCCTIWVVNVGECPNEATSLLTQDFPAIGSCLNVVHHLPERDFAEQNIQLLWRVWRTASPALNYKSQDICQHFLNFALIRHH